MSDYNTEYNRAATKQFLVAAGIVGTSICTLTTIAYFGFQNLIHKMDRQSSPTQPNTPFSTPENVIPATATLIPTPNSGDIPQNCNKILPGEYTWNAAQNIGDPKTIYDFELYEIRNVDGSSIGTIIPGQWDIRTSTENQKKLRQMLPGAIVCGKNPR